ncbi:MULTISPECIES: sigma-70 family RNA polymerase sigma factor [Geobacillus]|uniref:Fis family transcriptional regulator n=1 Tax=Geobacillus thermoleovorans TaxID=33941 RepID=A0A2Z3N7U6_GEOTH|nr:MULTISPECIES: sigma-70 family RNA polymerase sigma factor [Geobacillus]AMQ22237.1 Fis family transcriptional regulator [Geobacillus sp. JS12]AWO74956.1 Fis family transcriptional regulator [Geobacillus thermoleovorans]MBW7642570.1 sigma-70 family RNA polymerase sigma factor [Geobacillus thermoleovorans]MED3732540.1 sigma-70 family RNA polymerase sigma factor [Geobacillus stearothermophilus]MED3740128.1 sigma-70 family RNA polymerase sigma factor [Geobacillus stearothermophilus]
MEELLKQYRESLRLAKKLLEKASDEDKKIIRGMISDLEFAIEWMTTGRRPGNRRGIERRAAYQREKPFDPLLMQKFFRSSEPTYEWDDHEKESVITEWDRQRIEDALSVLTDREREVYLMSRGYCLTYSEIANYLCISSSSVQTMIERAEKKIKKRINESLFCLCG